MALSHVIDASGGDQVYLCSYLHRKSKLDRQQHLTYTTFLCPLRGIQQLASNKKPYNCWTQHRKNKEKIL